MSAGSVYGVVWFTSSSTLFGHAPRRPAGNESTSRGYPMAQPALTIARPIIGGRCGAPVPPVQFLCMLHGVMISVRALSWVNSASCSHEHSCIKNACVLISPPAWSCCGSTPHHPPSSLCVQHPGIIHSFRLLIYLFMPDWSQVKARLHPVLALGLQYQMPSGFNMHWLQAPPVFAIFVPGCSLMVSVRPIQLSQVCEPVLFLLRY